jgi:hypothetical protein
MTTNFPIKDSQTTTNLAFIDSSERAKTPTTDSNQSQIGIQKYPWRTLPEGKSFFIDTNTNAVKLQTIQSAACRWSKKLTKKFRVLNWPNGIEVARLPMHEVEPRPTISFFDNPDLIVGKAKDVTDGESEDSK